MKRLLVVGCWLLVAAELLPAQIQAYRFTLLRKADGSAAGVFDIRDGGEIRPPANGAGSAHLGDAAHLFADAYINSLQLYGASALHIGASLTVATGSAVFVSNGGNVTFDTGSSIALDTSVGVTTHNVHSIGSATHAIAALWIGSAITMLNGSSLLFVDAGLGPVGSLSNSGGALQIGGTTTFVGPGDLLLNTNITPSPDNTYNAGQAGGGAKFAGVYTHILEAAGLASFHRNAAGASSVKVQNDSSSGFSTVEFLDSSGNSKGLVGYANSGVGVAPSKFIVGTNGASPVAFYVNGLLPFEITTSGNLDPTANATYKLGSGAGAQWLAINVDTAIVYGTLSVSNAAAVSTSSGFGVTGTKTVRNAAGSGTCTLIFDLGIFVGGTC